MHACISLWGKVFEWIRLDSLPLFLSLSRTNVPNVRLAYRYETLMGELEMLLSLAMAHDATHC